MRAIVFEGDTWEHYEELSTRDARLLRWLQRLLKEMLRGDPARGTGKPEPLEHGLSGLGSRRISQRDRLIDRYDDEYLYLLAIGGHYDDR
jgi:toxin YoeB